MRIVHVVEPFSSGIVTFIAQLVNGMNSYEHIVVHGSRVSEDNVDSVRMQFREGTQFILWRNAIRKISFIKDITAAIELFQILKRVNPQVVHLHSSKAGFIGRVVGVLLKAKILYTPNGLSFARLDIDKASKFLFKFLERLASMTKSQIICCSCSEHNLLKTIGIKSIYINNGILVSAMKVIPHKQKEYINVGCVALITEQKNPSEFAEIARYFHSRSDIRFTWIGDGHLRSELNSSNIQVTGWCEKEKVNDYLNELDIYLSCSLWEGLPFSVLEAMNASKCLLLRNCVGNVDLVSHGQNGFLYTDTNEAIEFLDQAFEKRDMLKEMGEISRKLLRSEFNSSNMIESYIDVYSK